MARTDIHRPSVLCADEYGHVVTYSLGTTHQGLYVPPLNTEEVRAREERARSEGLSVYGAAGRCGSCGASFKYGELARHESGDLIHFGWECADKISLVADRMEFSAELGKARSVSMREFLAAERAEAKAELLANHPGLEDALKNDHYIIRDIADRFEATGDLSEAQINLVFRLIAPDAHVAAPVGRVTFAGEVVTIKEFDGFYGLVIKVLVKVHTDEGSWLAWGTLPKALSKANKGDRVEMTATLEAGDEPYFARMKRPSKARFV